MANLETFGDYILGRKYKVYTFISWPFGGARKKPNVMIHVCSLGVSPTAGREAEHIPEGRRIPLLIAAMGCWEFSNPWEPSVVRW